MTDRTRFDPTAPLPGPPDPWAYARQPEPSRRAAVPHDRHDRRRAGARRPDPRARVARRRPAAARWPPRSARRSRPATPVVVTGCGTSEHGGAGRRRDPARGARRRRAAPAPVVVAEQAFELSLDPPGARARHRHLARGRHERHERARSRRRGRPAPGPRVVTVSGRSPAGALADDRRRDRRARPELVPHGRLRQPDPGRAPRSARTCPAGRSTPTRSPDLLAAGARDEAGAERIAGALGRRRAPARHRVRRRPAGRPRAGPQGRGGVLAAVGLPRPRDVPPRPPAGDRRRDRARPDPRRSRRPRRAARAGRARRWRPRGSIGIRARRDPAADLDAPSSTPSLTPAGRLLVADDAAPARARSPPCSGTATPLQLLTERLPRPRAPTPTRSAATTRSTCRRRRGRRRAEPQRRTRVTGAHRARRQTRPIEGLAHDVDHVEVPGQEVLEHDPLDARPPRSARTVVARLVGRAGDPARRSRSASQLVVGVRPERPRSSPRRGSRISASSRPIEHADHRRAGQRRRVAPDRLAGRVELGVGRPDRVRARRRRQVELVGVAGGQPVRARRPLAADQDPRPRAADRRPRPARDVDRLRLEVGVRDRDLVARRTTSRPARPTGRAGSRAGPRAGRPAPRSAGTAGRAGGARARSSRPRRRPRSGRRSSRRRS